MQHSVLCISKKYEEISNMRRDRYRFNANNFFQFAKMNFKKYHLIENGTDLLVSTWYSNDLIADYIKTIKK